LFIDGVGIGRRNPAVNPLARERYLLSQFHEGGEALPGGTLQKVDATFGVTGRPQSATNQTALLTGEAAPVLLGRHLLGYPNAPLRALIAQRSIVKRMVAAGRAATFLNSYPVGYLDALELAHRPAAGADIVIAPAMRKRLRPSATTCAMSAGQVALRTLEDARRDDGLTHDIDGRRSAARGLPAPQRSPEEAAEVFWKGAQGADFALFEHYLADEAGHLRDGEMAAEALSTFDRFARAVVARRPEDAQVLICSDHGNVEDLSTRSHTLNPVPVLSFGPAPLPPLRNLADLGMAILSLLGVPA
jgi:hypothetical protein